LNEPNRTFAIVCGNENCPARGISFHSVSADTEELAELWIEQYGHGSEDPTEHCSICGELGVAMDYVEYKAMLGLGDTRNGLLWRCVKCGNVTPRDPLTTPSEVGNCGHCNETRWKATSLAEIWKERFAHGG